MLKLTDPYQSVFVIDGLRQSSLTFLTNSMNENGRNGSLNLLTLVNEDTLEARAIFGAIRKLTAMHTGAPSSENGDTIKVLDQYMLMHLEAMHTIYGYNTDNPWIIDAAMLSCFQMLACELQVQYDNGKLRKFSEDNLSGTSQMAGAIIEAECSVLLGVYSQKSIDVSTGKVVSRGAAKVINNGKITIDAVKTNPGAGRNITQVQVSPGGGGRHGELPYVKISTNDQGIIKIVDGPQSLYKSDAAEKATIIFNQ